MLLLAVLVYAFRFARSPEEITLPAPHNAHHSGGRSGRSRCGVRRATRGQLRPDRRLASIHFAQVISVAERLKPERLYEEFLDFRRTLGMKIPPHAGAEGCSDQLVDLVRDNGLLALLADRDLSRNGCRWSSSASRRNADRSRGDLAAHRCRCWPPPCTTSGRGPTCTYSPPVEKPAGDWTRPSASMRTSSKPLTSSHSPCG